MELTTIPLFDHHCHALRRAGAALDGVAFRRHFSESTDPTIAPHLPYSMFYRRGLRDLAALLGCEPTEEAVVVKRHEQPLEDYARHLFEAGNIGMMLIDTGFRSVENYSMVEHRDFLPCKVYEVLRLEALVEQLIGETASFAQLEDAYRAALVDLRGQDIVSLKSIAAYRGGLHVEPRSRDEAAASYPALKEAARRYGRVRLSDRPMLEYMLRIGLEAAAAQELPVQFHTGFGDDDADLRTANPLHLRPLLQDESLRGASFVLLHTFPFAQEAGYLAGIYGHVYVDLSLTIPFTAHGGTNAILDALQQAPTSKVLLSTDAFTIPELFYLGALYNRECLAEALEQLQARRWLTASETEHAARQMLYENAAGLYGVG
jgi:hypothetical protein